MNLSYEEFIKLIPEETKKYVNNVLKCLNQYVIGRSNIYKEIVGEDSTLYLEGYYYDIAIFSEMLTETNDYANIIRNIRRKNIISISNSRGNFILEDTKKVDDETYKKIFNMYKESFLIYDDISYYYGLTPLEILNNFIIKNDIYTTDDNYLFPNKLSAINAKNNITKIIKEKRKEFESNLSIELFKDVPIDIVNIITNASKIYNYNIKHINGMLYNNIYDLVSDSILLSYLHSEDTDIKNIVKKLELPSGVIEFYKKEYADITGDIDFEPNYYGIKMYYQKYYNDLKNKTIENMFINLFNRDITKSTYVEEILNKYNIDKEKVINIFDTRTTQEKLEDILSNYSYDINKLINLSKIYSLTLKKINTNNSYLRNNNDILSYSYFTYLTFYEKDNILYNYFNDNMIDLNKINSLFNINLTQEEIEKENISLECINDIVAKNINNFDEYFINETKSKFLINIFNLLSNEKIENLNNELNNYKIQKEIEYKDKIYLELFDSLDKDTISFIKLLVENNKYLTDNIKLNISKKDLIVLSIIYSSFGEFLYEKYGITKEDSNKFLGINNTKKDNYNYTEEDNELLYKNYYDFIFNGFNSDINRKDIKPQHILRNIFNKSLYNGAFLIKYLHNFNLNSNDFDDLITKYDNFLYEKQTKTMIDNICKYDNEKVYLELIIYKALAINTRLNEINTNLNEIDKEKISLILSYIITYTIYFDDIKYKDDENIFGIKSLSDNNITLNNISKYLNISIEELKYNTSLVDYKLFSNYAKYFNFDVDENSNALIKMMSKLFDQEINNSNILSIIGNLSDEDNIKLNIELKTFKPYIPTISECIDSLRSLEVKEMNMEDVNDILNYGNELSKHFVTINDMEHKLLNGDSNEKSIANINEIITESYEVIEPKKSFFKWLFYDEDTTKENITIKLESIPKLKDAISTNISILSNELLTYDKIRKYIIEYIKKNKEYSVKTNEIVVLLENKLNTLSNDKEYDYIENLQTSSQLQIAREKQNRFNTSNQLLNQELFKINQAIVNHFITINALEMARDDLLPLISSELIINEGNKTESSSLELSKNIMDLFKAMLARNVDSTKEVLNKINNIYSLNGTMELLNMSINNYINIVNNSNNETEHNKRLIKEKENI